MSDNGWNGRPGGWAWRRKRSNSRCRTWAGLAAGVPDGHALRDGGSSRFLLLLKAKGHAVALVGPDLRLHRRPADASGRRYGAVRGAADPGIDRLLEAAEVAAGRRDRVRAAMLRERLATQTVGGCWILRLPATAPFLAQASACRPDPPPGLGYRAADRRISGRDRRLGPDRRGGAWTAGSTWAGSPPGCC